MKIALLSDIHANLPALEAALEDIERNNADAIYCLGDLIGYNIWPNEVINIIKQRGVATIAGNHDLKVEPPGTLEVEYPLSPKKYAYTIVGNAERDYLLSLPTHIRLEYHFNGKPFNLLFVHGSPRKVDEYLLEDMDEQLLSGIMMQAGADVLCFGHSHKPFHRVINTGQNEQNYYRHAINIGSAGKPKDNNPNGCYVLLTINKNTSTADYKSVEVIFKRFAYDIEKAANAIEESPLPNELADMLRKGY